MQVCVCVSESGGGGGEFPQNSKNKEIKAVYHKLNTMTGDHSKIVGGR